VPWGAGTHGCCVYATEEQRLAAAADFFQMGAAHNERLLYLADLDRGSLDGVVRALDDAGFHARWSQAGGQLTVRSTDDSYLEGGTFDGNRVKDVLRRETEEALATGYRGLRVVGEMTWARRGTVTPATPATLAAYESEVNELFGDATLTALCQYDRGAFSDDTLDAVVAPHRLVTSGAGGDDGFTASRGDHGRVRVTGEVDFADAHLLRAFLRGCVAATASGADDGGDLDVDIAEVSFLDIAGLRALVETAQDLGSSRALAIRGARPLVRRVLELTGWDDMPNLRVRPDEPERTAATSHV
jgi:anti-anti-sigma factor